MKRETMYTAPIQAALKCTTEEALEVEDVIRESLTRGPLDHLSLGELELMAKEAFVLLPTFRAISRITSRAFDGRQVRRATYIDTKGQAKPAQIVHSKTIRAGSAAVEVHTLLPDAAPPFIRVRVTRPAVGLGSTKVYYLDPAAFDAEQSTAASIISTLNGLGIVWGTQSQEG